MPVLRVLVGVLGCGAGVGAGRASGRLGGGGVAAAAAASGAVVVGVGPCLAELDVLIGQSAAAGMVVDIINERVEGDLTAEGAFTITLDAYEGLALRVVSNSPL